MILSEKRIEEPSEAANLAYSNLPENDSIPILGNSERLIFKPDTVPIDIPTPQPPKNEHPESEKKKGSNAYSSLFTLFKFTDNPDKILTGFAMTFSVAQGIILPFIAFIVGRMTNSLNETDTNKLVDKISDEYLIMIYIGIAIFVAGYIAALLWNTLSARQTMKVKQMYYRKLLRLSIAWYDKQVLNEIPANFTDHTNDFSSSLSIKLHLYIMHLAIVFGGILVSFIQGYILTLILLALTPLMFFFMYLFMKFIQKTEQYQRKHYSRASSISNEALTYIKSVKSLNGEEHEIQRYTDECVVSKRHAIKYGYIAGTLFGGTFFSIYIVYSFAFYISVQMIKDRWYNANTGDIYQVGDLLTIYFSNLISIFALGQVSPLYKNLETGKAAVKAIRKIIKTPFEEESDGIFSDKINGRWEFVGVSFAYPTAPDRLVLDNVSFVIEPGQKAAFVGPSGCGKSTIIQLMLRFYAPTEGKILLDGIDLSLYNLKCLRSKLGYVQQQPILFAKSVKYNVSIGSTGIEVPDDKLIWDALEMAMAKEFVENIEGHLDFFVGSQGGQLSGGQKQRIAISRIALRRPDVWLFDEATSALDSENEAIIQRSIDRITDLSTSITIAHRLSTIENAQCIFVLKDGKIIESGNHQRLLAIPKGVYRGLHDLQSGKRDYRESMHNVSRMSLKSPVKENMASATELLPATPVLDQEISPEPFEMAIKEGPDEPEYELDDSYLATKESAEGPEKTIKKDSKKKTNKGDRKFKLWNFMGRERYLLIPGVLASLANGAVMPIVGFLLGKALGYFLDMRFSQNHQKTLTGMDFDELVHSIYMIIVAAVGVSVGSFLFNSLQYGIFNHVGEEYTLHLRGRYFRKLMYMDLEYFDDRYHQPSALSTQLAEECKAVNSLIGSFFGSIIQSLSSFAIGLLLAFIYAWKITLVLLALSPLIFISGVMEALLLHQVKSKSDGSEFNLLGESLENIKIVKSLTAEEKLLAEFDAYCLAEKKRKLKVMLLTSATIGYAQGSMFVVFAIVFRIGAVFIKDSSMNQIDFLITMFSIIIGLFGAGMAAQFLGTLGPAQAAAKVLLKEINTETKIERDPTGFFPSTSNSLNLRPEFKGEIRFENVSFKYKSQKHRTLKRINFTLPAGKSSAFAGGSGSGKSTIFQLLLRFYEPQSGTIYVDNVDIRDFDIYYLRSKFGVVRQEPSLFSGTIQYNIAYNLPLVTREEMVDACDKANANEFVFLHEEEFSRDVGSFGTKMSGGEKQRICIARVLLRKPNMFLFDEATSALDAKAELMVQKAIERIKESHTTITIAHRISTIKNSNLIVVLDGGRVVESGSYQQLLANNGKFVEISKLRPG